MWQDIAFLIQHLRAEDFVDLFLVWIVVYRVLVLTKQAGAAQILTGLGFLAMAYLSSIWLELMVFHWFLEKFFSNLFLIVVVLFQGEIRQALAQIGSNPFFYHAGHFEETNLLEEIAKSAMHLAQRGYGALIVLEREIELDYFVETGRKVDSLISSEMLASVFHPDSPLHDGAVLIKGGRIDSAGCFLPLTKNPILDKNLGTRHRAAIGVTEETDALVLVVSEENNSVGIVYNGDLEPDVDLKHLRKRLFEVFEVKKPVRKERGSS